MNERAFTLAAAAAAATLYILVYLFGMARFGMMGTMMVDQSADNTGHMMNWFNGGFALFTFTIWTFWWGVWGWLVAYFYNRFSENTPDN